MNDAKYQLGDKVWYLSKFNSVEEGVISGVYEVAGKTKLYTTDLNVYYIYIIKKKHKGLLGLFFPDEFIFSNSPFSDDQDYCRYEIQNFRENQLFRSKKELLDSL